MSYIFYTVQSILFCLWLFPNCVQAKSCKDQQKPVITLFHGLGNKAASFDSLKQGLEEAFPTASVVALASVEGRESIKLSIEQQAEAYFQELSGKVSGLSDRPMLLVGHSLGGLVAYAFYKLYGHLFKIKGLVTAATPWKGVAGARVDAEMLSQHLTDPVLEDLRMLSLSLGFDETHFQKQIGLNVQVNQEVCRSPAGRDLIEGSGFLGKVKAWLPHEQLPILAIGGGGSDFRDLLHKKKKHRFKALNSIYTFFVVGKPYGHHDMQVSLDSQHAVNLVSESKKNFRREFIKDAFHSTHVLGLPVPKSKAMLSHPRVLYKIKKFAKRIRMFK
ncbi:alpha/beta hydrolase [Cardinium endosymbiont of Philonthus spinipes]|uniref:esterase/lipase family protein n=1 Tax=Cardinium endosymbiont of Philonthus spinipes TaxID=3077941 RepID=UPI00313F2F35